MRIKWEWIMVYLCELNENGLCCKYENQMRMCNGINMRIKREWVNYKYVN